MIPIAGLPSSGGPAHPGSSPAPPRPGYVPPARRPRVRQVPKETRSMTAHTPPGRPQLLLLPELRPRRRTPADPHRVRIDGGVCANGPCGSKRRRCGEALRSTQCEARTLPRRLDRAGRGVHARRGPRTRRRRPLSRRRAGPCCAAGPPSSDPPLSGPPFPEGHPRLTSHRHAIHTGRLSPAA